MFSIFGEIKGFTKLHHITIDSGVFKLHYKATFIILLACSLLMTSRQYIGDPIDCIVEEIPNHVMDEYCWIHPTFSVTSHDASGVQGFDLAHPGVAPLPTNNDDGEGIRYHKYYQWVCFTFAFQAIIFYAPYFMWKIWEGGRLKLLVQEMNMPIVEKDLKKERIKLLINYLGDKNRSNYNFYAFRYYLCEFLNLVNVIGQIYFVDLFLGGEFTRYGSDVLSVTEQESLRREDPMSRIFPKMTKCTFHKFGPSGTIEKFDGICVLPLNILNEKIYVFLWFWFVILSVITGVHFFYRLVCFLIPSLREYALKSRCRLVPRDQIETVVHNCRIGDWFILYMLSKNMDTLIFKDFMASLSKMYSEPYNYNGNANYQTKEE